MICPICGAVAVPSGGCWACVSCGWSMCDNRVPGHLVDDESGTILRQKPVRKRKRPVQIIDDTVTMFYFTSIN